MATEHSKRIGVTVVILILAALLLSALFPGQSTSMPPLVVYCAHDALFAEGILRQFEDETGIPIHFVPDSEATKSLGLVNRIIQEKNSPQCDLFWNNQLMGTLDLADQQLLLPYKGTGFDRMPAAHKSADGTWVGFAARMRLYIVNTNNMPATSETLEQHLAGDLSRMAIAKPLYGTTRSHYSLLWHLWGADKLKSWHKATRERGLIEVPGNGPVKNLVAAGTCDFGWTDTDDFFVARDNNDPVAMLPYRTDDGQTICIPNTVSIVRGCKNLTDAQKLVDYLLSARVELALANSKSRQIPLGPVDSAQLSDEVRQLQQWAEDACDLKQIGEDRIACLEWLKSEYLK